MLFNSLQFIVFFPIVIAAYFALNHKYRWILLLVASYYFYMCWNYKYVFLIAITTIINYSAGIGIGKTKVKFIKNLYLTLGVGSSLSILFFFKYFNFFGGAVNSLFEQFNIFYQVPAYQLLLPVGISFYTFQTLSYTLDVYFGREKIEYHFGYFALFVSFFPQLVAGPIERSTNLLPQFKKKHDLNYDDVRIGLSYIIWGFFKKVVIADRLSEYVNMFYNNPGEYGSSQALVATIFFTFQIYCDFSGYSDIAIGTARIMGFRLMTNFRRPYFAVNIRDFWKRWHISLSTWFRDYFYIPLGGNRVGKWRNYYNLLATFVVSGLWHGANWTFIVWGGLHGFYLVFAIWTEDLRERVNSFIGLNKAPRLHRVLQIAVTFCLAVFAWIFFRANNVGEAFQIIKIMFTVKSTQAINLYRIPGDFYIAIIGIVVLYLTEILEETRNLSERLLKSSAWLKWILFLFLVLSIFVFGVWEGVDFLYFQF